MKKIQRPSKNTFQVLTHEYKDNPSIPNWIRFGYDIKFVENWQDISKNIPVICWADLLRENVRHWLNNRQPAIYCGRGYVGNHLYKKRLISRASVNGWANTVLKPIPYSRWEIMNLPKHPWKVSKIKNVLIAPSKMTCIVWTPDLKWEWATSIVDKFPGAEIKIREKPGKMGNRYNTLWNDLNWADLVVSQSSAITAEAFWYGKKVISTEPCITWAAERTTFDTWDDPSEPKLRDEWHEHLAWSQYTTEEWLTGHALECLTKYLGPVENYDPEHTYNINIV